MALKHYEQELSDALSVIGGVKTVTRGWPKTADALPCIAIRKAGETGEDWRDDAPYVTQVEYYVRVFAAKKSVCDRIADAVDDALAALGWTRTFAYEDEGESCQLALRYQKAA